MLPKTPLAKLYLVEQRSVSDIAKKYGCSQNRVTYWLKKHHIPKRTISDAIYLKNNPKGDPFRPSKVTNMEEAFLFGLGIGLYWGEGTKANTGAVRLGNSDPALIKAFIKFLDQIYEVDKNRLKFGLQIFTDIDPLGAIAFWSKALGVSKKQFYKPYITLSIRNGTYKTRSKNGVLTLYMGNTRLRNILVGEIEKMRSVYYDGPVPVKRKI